MTEPSVPVRAVLTPLLAAGSGGYLALTVAAIETHELAREFEGGMARHVDGVDLEVAAGRSTGFSARTAPARRRPCGCSPLCCSPPGDGRRLPATTSPRTPERSRRRIGVALQEAALDPLDDRSRARSTSRRRFMASPKKDASNKGSWLLNRVGLTSPRTVASAPTREACGGGSTSRRR